MRKGVSITADLGERRELPHRGPGQSPDRKRIWLHYCCEYYTGGNYAQQQGELPQTDRASAFVSQHYLAMAAGGMMVNRVTIFV